MSFMRLEPKLSFESHNCMKKHGEFSHKNPMRRKEAIRKAKREYEKSNRAKLIRLYNYEVKWNFLLNYKAQLGCKNCLMDNPVVLVFHHVYYTGKDFKLSTTCVTRSWKNILAEIEKCEVLCCNCHVLDHGGIHRKKGEIQKQLEETGIIEEQLFLKI